jgi:hypothetical protein
MTVTDPDVPDPLNDPRTLQADPGAVAEGEDLASTEDDAVATGEDELAESATAVEVADGGDGHSAGLLPGDPMAPEDAAPDDLTGDDLTGGIAGG